MIKITLKIGGMMCEMCESHVNDIIRNNFNVKKVTSSHSKGETTILVENDIDDNAVIKAVSDIGYKVKAVSKEPYNKKSLFRFLK